MTYACECDGDAPSVFSSRMIKAARKQHTCEECRARIKPGEPYEYTFGVWDGTANNFHICPLCVELRQWATISVPCFCFIFGELHQNVRDMVDAVRGDCPPGFVFEWLCRMLRIKHRAAESRA
jgi:hypothetical protein